MTVDTILSSPRPTRPIPIAVHATMGAVFIITILFRMTLGTQLLTIPVRQLGSVGSSQQVVVARIVTTQTAEKSIGGTVAILQTLVKLR